MPAEMLPLWTPPASLMEQSNMRRYMRWLEAHKGISCASYRELHQWSIENLASFWESIWQFFDVQSGTPWQSVLTRPAEGMIGTRWFDGATVNYARHIFSHASTDRPAIIAGSERGETREITWAALERQVASIAHWLRQQGVGQGDRVAAILPNIPETIAAFLAVNSLGAIWSSCSPDFGEASVADRFAQIEPKVVFLSDGYTYNGKPYPKTGSLPSLKQALSMVQAWVLVPWLDSSTRIAGTVSWRDVLETPAPELAFTDIPFNDPIWVLYSSGTTGKPKAITHSVGGCLLEHLKALALHQDVRPGEKYFWYSTTGWMMWNYALASMLCGSTLVLYEGSAGYPDLNVLWDFAATKGVQHFGGGAAFYIACMKAGLSFSHDRFPLLRTIGSTGSPLPPAAFEWIYASVKKDVWLISLSGGTDICSAFVGGCPLLPVYAGEIQCRMLGCALEAFDEQGHPQREALGEMVILEPMPSMPVFFWGDKDNERYHASYFEQYPGVWRHGDWIKITERDGVVIFGRSDATLNRDGVRIGTSEIYHAVEQTPEVADSLVVCLEEEGGRYFMPLFVVMRPNAALDDAIRKSINTRLRTLYSPRHVPDAIYAVAEIPYTISGKKMEAPVKKILMGMDPDKAASKDTMRNPGSLDAFLELRQELKPGH
ncbi:MAG: acetoacetate--CoA ligase [Chitinophagaceae bacterium]|nr:acetoacetate--CoA ligase [Chitinophagaceae bacterium]